MGWETTKVDKMVDHYDDLKAKGTVPFSFSKDVLYSSNRDFVHPALDPAYGGKRLSRDPVGKRARPVSLFLDVTGSNRENAVPCFNKLPQFFSLLVEEGWLEGHLNLQFGFVGDANSDKFPLQLSQFESDGKRAADWLRMGILEGKGGGQKSESYELSFWAACNQNDLQCWERGEKGIAVWIFDEMFYDTVEASQLAELYRPKNHSMTTDGVEISQGMKIETLKNGLVLPRSNIATTDIIADLNSKYDVYGIICGQSGYYDDKEVTGLWEKAFGTQSIIHLPDPNDITEMVAALVGTHSRVSRHTIESDLKALGTGKATINAVSNALAVLNPSTSSGLTPFAKNNKVTRI